MSKLPQAIFVGGSGRSGTTIMKKLIDVHSAVWPETHRESQMFPPRGCELAILMELGPKAPPWLVTQIEANVRRKFRAAVGGGPRMRLGAQEVDRRVNRFFAALRKGRYNEDSREEFMRRTGAFVRGMFVPPGHKGPWCEKSPWNSVIFDTLATAFPGAKLVHIMRDPRDVIDSVIECRWGGKGFAGAIDFYLEWAQMWESSRKRGVCQLPGYIEVRYEAFMREPRRWQQLWDALGLRAPVRPELAPVHMGRHKRWNRSQRRQYGALADKFPWMKTWQVKR
jgi:hypothetical protein